MQFLERSLLFAADSYFPWGRRKLAWCHVETPCADEYRGDGISTASYPGAIKDFLAVGTSVGAILLLEVIIAGLGHGGSGSGSAMPTVKVLPFRRVCASDDRPVSIMVFVFPGGDLKKTQRDGHDTTTTAGPDALMVSAW